MKPEDTKTPLATGDSRTPINGAEAVDEDLSLDLEPEEEHERTVETLTTDAFGEASGSEDSLSSLERELLEDEDDEFGPEHTTIAQVDHKRMDKAAIKAESDESVGTPGEAYYRDMIQEEISFSKATGYDREGTAIVPLAELARLEEERLRRGELEEDRPGMFESSQEIPVGEIIDVLRAARTVEEVAGVLVEIVSNIIPRVLLMWERHSRLYGFASRGMNLTEVQLLTIEMPKDVMQKMSGKELEIHAFRGAPGLDEMGGRFFELLGHVPPEILLIPVQVTARDRWILYADNKNDPLPEFEVRLVEVIASRAGARADWLLDRRSLW